jgi:hypothetical protein
MMRFLWRLIEFFRRRPERFDKRGRAVTELRRGEHVARFE